MCRLLYFVHILVLTSHFEHGQVLGFHSVSVVHSFIHSFILCVFEVVKLQYCVLCSHESFFTAWKSFFLFSCSVTPLAVCTTVTFYIVLYYSNNSCGEGMHLLVVSLARPSQRLWILGGVIHPISVGAGRAWQARLTFKYFILDQWSCYYI